VSASRPPVESPCILDITANIELIGHICMISLHCPIPPPDVLRLACFVIPAVTPMLEDVDLRYFLLLLLLSMRRNRRAFREKQVLSFIIDLMLGGTQ